MSETHIAVERSGLRAWIVGILAVAVVTPLVLLRFATMESAERPGGVIGYRDAGVESWVSSEGHTARAPAPDAASAANAPPAQAGEFPSPDGGAVAFLEASGEDAWLVIREGDVVTRMDQLSDPSSPALVVAGTKGAAHSAEGVPLMVAWSPDGRQLAWGSVARPPYNLKLAERGAWNVRSLPLVGGYVGELAWSPDGRYLGIGTYAANRSDHTVLMLDTLGDYPPRQVAHGCIMVWSPDSRYLALHGEPARQLGLWIVSVDGESRRVVDREVVPFTWVAE